LTFLPVGEKKVRMAVSAEVDPGDLVAMNALGLHLGDVDPSEVHIPFPFSFGSCKGLPFRQEDLLIDFVTTRSNRGPYRNEEVRRRTIELFFHLPQDLGGDVKGCPLSSGMNGCNQALLLVNDKNRQTICREDTEKGFRRIRNQGIILEKRGEGTERFFQKKDVISTHLME
jgi:hypothetical protein